MIENAALISYTPPPTVTSSGGEASSDPVAITGARCLIDRPKERRKQELGAVVVGAEALAFIPIEFAAGIEARGCISFELDRVGNGPRTMQVIFVDTYVKNSPIDHLEVYLKSL